MAEPGTVIFRAFPPSILCLFSCCCRSVEGAIPEALTWVLTCHCTEAVAVLWAPVCAGCALSSKTAARNLSAKVRTLGSLQLGQGTLPRGLF